MLKKTVLYKLILASALLAIVQMACNLTPSPAAGAGGIVKGVVYQDNNANGANDAGEGPLDGVTVSLADCGAAQDQVTPADGSFNFSGLPAGSCHVSVAKAGWYFSGSVPVVGYPVPVASDPALPTAFSIFMAPNNIVAPGATSTLAGSPTDTLTPTPETPTATLAATLPPTPSTPMVTPTSVNANCRYGPGTNYSPVGYLLVGQTVPILGTVTDQTWWQIDNSDSPGTKCFVASSVTTATGNLASVPLVPIPAGLVTNLSITTPSVVHGVCGGPNPTNFTVSITTNGPVTVVYHLEIYNGDGSLRNKTDDTTRYIAGAGVDKFDPAGAYKTDCGNNFKVKVIMTSPTSKSAQATWSVVYP